MDEVMYMLRQIQVEIETERREHKQALENASKMVTRASLAANEAEHLAEHWRNLAINALNDRPGWATHIQEDKELSFPWECQESHKKEGTQVKLDHRAAQDFAKKMPRHIEAGTYGSRDARLNLADCYLDICKKWDATAARMQRQRVEALDDRDSLRTRCEQAEGRADHWKRLAVRALRQAPGWATHIQEDIDAERDTEGGSDGE